MQAKARVGAPTEGAPVGGGPSGLRRSPLHSNHIDLGAKLAEFAGWEMPLSYPRGTVAEHQACRSDVAVFDVSHLGTVQVKGPDAFSRLQGTLTNDLSKIAPGGAQYTHLLADDGSVLDDLIVWWVAERRFDVMPNASNTHQVLEALGGEDVTDDRAVLAIQGPRARRLLALVAPEAASVSRFRVEEIQWRGVPCVVAGTGYTGEDGVEVSVPADAAAALWTAIFQAGATPAGLGARDTLRLEAGLPLHGHDLGPGITPLQAGLSWVIAWGEGEFPGRRALDVERAEGPVRRIRGLVADGRQPLRAGAAVHVGEQHLGTVTSGSYSPMLQKGIGLALVDTAAGLGESDPVVVLQRGRSCSASLARLPFWPPTGRSGLSGRSGRLHG